jgi:hypothetical protein
MVYIIGEKRIPLSDSGSRYALSNMIYYARAKDIGVVFVATNRSPSIKTKRSGIVQSLKNGSISWVPSSGLSRD